MAKLCFDFYTSRILQLLCKKMGIINGEVIANISFISLYITHFNSFSLNSLSKCGFLYREETVSEGCLPKHQHVL